MPILISVICFFFIIFSLAEAIGGADLPVWKTVSSMGLGVSLLLFLHVFSDITSVEMPVSEASLGVSAVLGVPGVVLLFALNKWFI